MWPFKPNRPKTRWAPVDFAAKGMVQAEHMLALDDLAKDCQQCSDTGYVVGWVEHEDPPLTKIKFTRCECGRPPKEAVENYVRQWQGMPVCAE